MVVDNEDGIQWWWQHSAVTAVERQHNNKQAR